MTRSDPRNSRWWRVAVGLAAAAALVGYAAPGSPLRGARTEPARPAVGPAAGGGSLAAGRAVLRTRPIEDIRVGDRVLGANPDRGEVANEELPDPRTWQQLEVELRKADGRRLSATLLRPDWWFDLHVDEDARTALIVIPELGVVGEGRVLSIRPCPPIRESQGNIVTGTFRHEVSGPLIRVCTNGECFTCTPNHPIWTATRSAFIRADQLIHGELLETRRDGARPVTELTTVETPETTVYNLEVGLEHVYEVGSGGTLVHNKCAGLHHFWPHSWGNAIPYGHRALTWLNAAEHTHIHQALSNFLFQRTGFYYSSMSGAHWVNRYGVHQLNRWLHEFHRQYSTTAEGLAIQQRIGHSVYDLFKAEYRYAVRNGYLHLP